MDERKMRDVAWIGDDVLCGKVRGILLSFHGLGYTADKTGPDTIELELARSGWLVVFPYYGPWSWMNRETRKFLDELVDSLYHAFAPLDDVPLGLFGGSMGGFSALLYARYARRQAAACCALFPACDLKYHFTERPDLPKTIHYAFRAYDEDMEALFVEHSPLSQVSAMPDIPYLLIHGDRDEIVNKEKHSDRMAAGMQARGLTIEYRQVEGMHHGWPMPLSEYNRVVEFFNAVRTTGSAVT